MYLIDTNIVIYALKLDKKLQSFMSKLDSNDLVLSSVSKLEVIMGLHKHPETFDILKRKVDKLKCFPFDSATVDIAFDLYAKRKGRLKFKDLMIAATAIFHNMTLITADSDFKNVPGLKIKLFTP